MIRRLAEVFHDGAIDYLDGITRRVSRTGGSTSAPRTPSRCSGWSWRHARPSCSSAAKERVLAILGRPEAAEAADLGASRRASSPAPNRLR